MAIALRIRMPSSHCTAVVPHGDMLAADLERIEADPKLEKSERMNHLFGEWNDGAKAGSGSRVQPIEEKRRGLLGWLLDVDRPSGSLIPGPPGREIKHYGQARAMCAKNV